MQYRTRLEVLYRARDLRAKTHTSKCQKVTPSRSTLFVLPIKPIKFGIQTPKNNQSKQALKSILSCIDTNKNQKSVLKRFLKYFGFKLLFVLKILGQNCVFITKSSFHQPKGRFNEIRTGLSSNF